MRGLKEEIEKIDKLLDYDFLAKEILVPTINLSIERKYITDIEAKILKKAIDKKVIQSNDLKDILQGRHSTEPSRQIRKLVDKKMLQRLGFKDYVISFGDNYLLRGVISVLGEKGFLPHFDEKP